MTELEEAGFCFYFGFYKQQKMISKRNAILGSFEIFSLPEAVYFYFQAV